MDDRMPYIHSCPRSGTHLLAASLKKNFYQDRDVGLPQTGMGHWRSRRHYGPKPYAKFFQPGAHVLYDKNRFQQQRNRIHFYIFRDGRDVAVSMWNAKVLINPSWRNWPFSKFLRAKLDWYLSPSRRIKEPKWTVVEQWKAHLASWDACDDVFHVRYEWLVSRPLLVLSDIGDWIGLRGLDLEPVTEIVGVAPGTGKIGTWRDVFTVDDLEYFHSIVPINHWGLWRADEIYSR